MKKRASKKSAQQLLFWIKTVLFAIIWFVLWILLPLYGKVFMIVWYGSLFFQSAFHHRYAAHRQYNMSPIMEKNFYFATWIFQGSSYLSPVAYAVMHRLHHAGTDTELDPHSPSFQKTLWEMMWRTRTIYNEIFHYRTFLGEAIEAKYFRQLPIWTWFDYVANHNLSRLFWIVFYACLYYWLGLYANTYGWEWIVIGLLWLMTIGIAPIHGAIINWWGHIYGYHTHDLKDTSSNISVGKTHRAHWYQIPFAMVMNFLMMGEDSHNNHHGDQNAINFAVNWWEYDIVYTMLLVLNASKLIQIKKRKR